MTYDSGTARAAYILDISQPRQAAAELRRLFQSVQQQGAQLSSGAVAPLNQQATSAKNAGLAQQKLATETQKTAAASNQAARAAQALATEQNRTAREAANTAAAQDRAAKSALQLAAAQQRAARQSQNGGLGPALPRTFAGFTPGGLNQAAGAFGLATLGPQIVGQAVSAGVEAGKAALALDRTLKLTKELTGTQALYNQVIGTAKTQQELYGGSLQENIAGIQGLVVTSRSTGAELTTLINLAQRLAVLDPAQGAEGARIALSEVLSGDPRSLARRYEIPLSALQKIKDESIPVAERLKILDQYLSKIGITSEVAANSVSNQAKAYNRLGVELGNLQTNTGRGLADTFEGAATGLGRFLGVVNSNPRAIAEVKALLAGKSGIDQGDIEQEVKNLRVTRVIDAQKGAGDAAFARDKITGVTASTDALEAAKNKLIVFGASSDQARDKVVALYAAFAHTGDIQAFIQGAREIETSTTRGTKAIQDQGAALKADVSDKINAAIETGKLAFQQRQLEADSLAAVNGLLGAGDQALILAKKYGIATSQAQFLIDAQARLSNAAALTDQRVGERAPGASGTAERNAADELRAQRTFERLAQPEKDRQASKAKADAAALRDAQDALNLSRAITKEQKIRELQRQQAATADPVEKLRLQAQIEQEKRSGAGRVSAAQSTALQLNNVEENSQLQLLRTQREGLERLRDQELDFDLRRVRSKEDFEEKRRSLLARGQRAAAAALTKEFEKDTRREQEDFDIQRRRTLRNNAESTGDIGDRTDLRTSQIGARAALRGIVPVGGTIPPAALGDSVAARASASQAPRVIQIVINGQVAMDSKLVGRLIYDAGLGQIIDDDLSISILTGNPPGSGQSAVAGL